MKTLFLTLFFGLFLLPFGAGVAAAGQCSLIVTAIGPARQGPLVEAKTYYAPNCELAERVALRDCNAAGYVGCDVTAYTRLPGMCVSVATAVRLNGGGREYSRIVAPRDVQVPWRLCQQDLLARRVADCSQGVLYSCNT